MVNKLSENKNSKNADRITLENQKAKLGPELNFEAREAYRLLRTNLIFSLPAKDRGNIIGITSSAPGEGKSFTAINVAYSFAEAGYNVMLVDSDMRRPAIAKMLNVTASSGLSNILVGNENSVVNSGVLHKNMSVVVSGAIPPNPAELLETEKMKVVLDVFTKHYDYIIVDLPPITAVSDPLIVSKYLDGMLLVLRHNYTRRRALTESIRQLKFVGAHILGFVYNSYSKNGSSYSHKYYRNKYYKGDYKSYNPEEK